MTVNELFLEAMTEIVKKENNKAQEKNNMGWEQTTPHLFKELRNQSSVPT